VLVLGVLGTLAIATVDLLLGGRLSMFFDLAFITLCLGLGLLPRPDASYGVAFVPPVVLVLAFALIAAVDPALVTDEAHGLGHAVLGGLSEHAGSLAVGYALCLAALGLRLRGGLSPRTG
jgi:hypothetical protein